MLGFQVEARGPGAPCRLSSTRPRRAPEVFQAPRLRSGPACLERPRPGTLTTLAPCTPRAPQDSPPHSPHPIHSAELVLFSSALDSPDQHSSPAPRAPPPDACQPTASSLAQLLAWALPPAQPLHLPASLADLRGLTPQPVLGGPQKAATGLLPPRWLRPHPHTALTPAPGPREAFRDPPHVTFPFPYWKLLEGSCSQGLGPQDSFLLRQWCADSRRLIIKFLGIS